MNPLMEQLHDIEGLDPIGWWPLAIGWWIVIGLAFSILIALICFIAYRMAFNRSWKHDTLQKLAHLEKNLTDQTARETLIALSEYLRRVAVKRYPRKECAGLIGGAWLKWLAAHDPHQFDWEAKGSSLIKAPYAPLNVNLATVQISELITAARHWVR